tara:strand:- start:4826 stop:5164 length:339 start_codon:yes stop_codon:yes gene_type:complete
MKKIITITFLALSLFPSCLQSNKDLSIETEEPISTPRSPQLQKEIDELLAKDAENKKLEKEYLEQIRIAQENNDTEAFEFFFQEYIDVERLSIPEELKKEPNYVEGGVNLKY